MHNPVSMLTSLGVRTLGVKVFLRTPRLVTLTSVYGSFEFAPGRWHEVESPRRFPYLCRTGVFHYYPRLQDFVQHEHDHGHYWGAPTAELWAIGIRGWTYHGPDKSGCHALIPLYCLATKQDYPQRKDVPCRG